MSRQLIGFEEAKKFMDTILPPVMLPERRRSMQVRFYTWLCGYRTAHLDIVYVCPYCGLTRGKCRCKQLGFWGADMPRRTWIYESEAKYVLQWRIDLDSLLRIDTGRLDTSLATERRLGEFITYLKRH